MSSYEYLGKLQNLWFMLKKCIKFLDTLRFKMSAPV